MLENNSLTGKKFGKLTVHNRNYDVSQMYAGFRIYYNCTCDCGNNIVANKYNITSGNTKSCGCIKTDVNRKRARLTARRHHGYTIAELAKASNLSINTARKLADLDYSLDVILNYKRKGVK